MKLSVIIPAYNERRTIREVVAAVEAVPFPVEHEILIIDDASTDGTREILLGSSGTEAPLRIFVNPTNLGKGASVKRALEHVQGEIVIVQDADLELDPRDIPSLIRPII